MNPVEIEDSVSQLASEPFDRREFAFRFLAAFGNKKTTIDRLSKPRECFLVPIDAIDEAIERVKDGTIGNYHFDRAELKLVHS